MKLHFGCGENKIPGWSNHDIDVDIRKKLPFSDRSAQFILAEHVIEHVTFPEGFRFLTECLRVLRTGGALRLSFPDPLKVWELSYDERDKYRELVSQAAYHCIEKTYLPLRTTEDSLRLLFCGWGHQSMWTQKIAFLALHVAGFYHMKPCIYGESMYGELRGIEGHHKASPAALLETCVLEATKE